MNKKIIINIPRDNVNDEECKLIELFYSNGDKVDKGDIIATFETSKATFDISAEIDGFIFFKIKVDDTIPVGSAFCIISRDATINDKDKKLLEPKKNTVEVKKDSNKIISKDALILINQHSIDIDEIKKIGLIKKSDIEEYLIQKNEKSNSDQIIETLVIDQEKKNLIIVGAGGHAKMIIDIIVTEQKYNLIGIVDAASIVSSNKNAPDSILGIPIICNHLMLQKLFEMGIDNAVNALGFIDSPNERDHVFKLLKDIGFQLPNVIHKTAIIESSAKLGEGNHILANSLIGSSSTIGDNCIINSGSIITHDVNIRNNVHITPGVLIAGYVNISSNTIIGMGSTLHFKINIGSNVRINNGSNIIGDISDGSIIKND